MFCSFQTFCALEQRQVLMVELDVRAIKKCTLVVNGRKSVAAIRTSCSDQAVWFKKDDTEAIQAFTGKVAADLIASANLTSETWIEMKNVEEPEPIELGVALDEVFRTHFLHGTTSSAFLPTEKPGEVTFDVMLWKPQGKFKGAGMALQGKAIKRQATGRQASQAVVQKVLTFCPLPDSGLGPPCECQRHYALDFERCSKFCCLAVQLFVGVGDSTSNCCKCIRGRAAVISMLLACRSTKSASSG